MILQSDNGFIKQQTSVQMLKSEAQLQKLVNGHLYVWDLTISYMVLIPYTISKSQTLQVLVYISHLITSAYSINF